MKPQEPGPRSKAAHLLSNSTDLLGGQIVERKHKPPVEVALATKGAVVHICLLFVLFESHHPAGHMWERTVLISPKLTNPMAFPTDLHNQVGNLDLDQEIGVEAKELGKGIPRKSPWCPQHTTEWDHLTSQGGPQEQPQSLPF